jgi:hypothetical protein
LGSQCIPRALHGQRRYCKENKNGKKRRKRHGTNGAQSPAITHPHVLFWACNVSPSPCMASVIAAKQMKKGKERKKAGDIQGTVACCHPPTCARLTSQCISRALHGYHPAKQIKKGYYKKSKKKKKKTGMLTPSTLARSSLSQALTLLCGFVGSVVPTRVLVSALAGSSRRRRPSWAFPQRTQLSPRRQPNKVTCLIM